jgi:SAM-dependent methyltransferase
VTALHTGDDPGPETGAAVEQITQWDMAHPLPRARFVDRVDYLIEQARGRRTIHVGFVDSRCTDYQRSHDAWLHGLLAAAATELVGLDIDDEGVERARRDGYEAHTVDCRDSAAVGALGLAPADVVIAGEIIEHLDDPGDFLDGLARLVDESGVLVVTTPNAHGLFNAVASIAGFELNHPDHVTMFSWYTLWNLLQRHGWEPVETCVYVPRLKQLDGSSLKTRVLGRGAQAVLGLERVLARSGRPFVADGLIFTVRRRAGASPA